MNTVPVLFDINACFGKPATGGSEFPAIQDRLNDMDRLGISRALVWNVDATQGNVLSSNHALLDGIRKTSGAKGRIFPALSVSGLVIYEGGGMDTFVQQMKAIPCRALRFNSVNGLLTLSQLDPLMRRIRGLKPFIIMRGDQASAADILEFAKAFPDVTLILTEVMWGSTLKVFDLMRRRKNILMDISWHHTFNGIELGVKHFGADRFVFGVGSKSHNGAAIGALARADITEAQRRKIAFGNLDRLTGLKTSNMVSDCCWTANTLWPKFLTGKPLGVDVVDAHGHVGPSPGYVVEAHDECLQIKAGLKAMDAIGIRTQLISGMHALFGGPVEGNDLMDKLLRPHANRISGYVVFNPFYADELVPKLDAYFAGPVYKGFKTLCDYWKVSCTDKRFAPMWAYANKHHLPVLSHTWSNSMYDSPALYKDLVRRYPNVSFLLGHSGGGDSGRYEAEALAQKHPNVYLEWCGSFCSTVCWEDSLKRVDPCQMVFGTDSMVHDFNWELGRLLSLNVPDKVLIPFLGGNMRRILAKRK